MLRILTYYLSYMLWNFSLNLSLMFDLSYNVFFCMKTLHFCAINLSVVIPMALGFYDMFRVDFFIPRLQKTHVLFQHVYGSIFV